MRKRIKVLYFLLVPVVYCNSQTSTSKFNKTVDSINRIIKANPLAYYLPNKQYGAFIKKIGATQQGIISFTDSIPESEITITKHTEGELISDCCSQYKSRTLDLFEIKNWDIYFPIAYLMDENKKSFAKFIGFKKPDLENLQEQLEKLKSLCKK